ncbi:MAG TPA: FUSC family protein, partial [Mycobacteriales bacterium]|nr:FUSC family protein [Mycobacteriales bacterium]
LAAALAGSHRLTLPHALPPALTRLPAQPILALPRQAGGGLQRIAGAVRDPRSPAFRHAVRLAAMMLIAEGVSRTLPWQRGYWVTLTVVVVLKPDYAATMQRGVARIVGTALGVGVSGLLAVAIHPTDVGYVLLVTGFSWAAYAGFGVSYAVYSVAITALVVLLLSPAGSGNELSTVADRGLDTAIGGALALAGYAAWPTWERATLASSLDRLFERLADYAAAVLARYVDPSADRTAIGRAATSARQARVDAQASLDRALAEPTRAGADTQAAVGLMASARRIVIALHALRTTLDDATEHVALPEAATVREAITDALRGVAADDPARADGLRERQRTLEAASSEDPASLRGRRLALLAAHLDPLVDSIDTAMHVRAGGSGQSAELAERLR